ncbi:MAG: hypothetical protein MI807_20220 [Verrucomicrobiales bacterium]|nr:hypothetical protein [Verrucomicrobiales bacterium]
MSESTTSESATDVSAAWLIAIGVLSGLAGLFQFALSAFSEGFWLMLIGFGTTVCGFAIKNRMDFAFLPTAVLLISGMTQHQLFGIATFGFALYQLWRARSDFWPFLHKRAAEQDEDTRPDNAPS